jgi:hypothetical protein
MLGVMGFVWFIIMAIIMIIPFWKIFQKAGFNPALSLLMLIPLVNIIAIFYLAFAAWPASRGGQPPRPPQG